MYRNVRFSIYVSLEMYRKQGKTELRVQLICEFVQLDDLVKLTLYALFRLSIVSASTTPLTFTLPDSTISVLSDL